MSLKVLGVLSVLVICASAQNWRGNIVPYTRAVLSTCYKCVCRYWWGCSQWRAFGCVGYVNSYRCETGWTHNGDYNCILPVCLPNCGSVGSCMSPGVCNCNGQAVGANCETLTCSYTRPCYPGNCFNDDKCSCSVGFTKELGIYGSEYGCLQIAKDNLPAVGRSTLIISHIRRTDESLKYYFLVDGTLEGTPNGTEAQRTVWSNQRIFNSMDFEFEASFDPSETLPERPGYVHSVKLGIVEGNVHLRVRNYAGVEHATQKYDFSCPAVGGIESNPPVLFNCTVRNQEFKTLIEHADTLEVTFEAKNGGARRLVRNGQILSPESFTGRIATKQVFLKFDFQAPLHCTEEEYSTTKYTSVNCVGATVLNIASEFTKEPIHVTWKGWTDDFYGAQMWMYYLELHKLVTKDATLELTELNPLEPMYSADVMHTGSGLHQYTFTPNEPGMYSVLLEARDIANNSRTARRLVLFDSNTAIELSTDNKMQLHVSTAAEETGYLWQSFGSENENTTIRVDWTGLFMNRRHNDEHLLNRVKVFPPQFKDVEDDGILFARKFVDPKLDDTEGSRTLDVIPNTHGIVKFEYQYSDDVSLRDPPGSWMSTTSLVESQEVSMWLQTGDQRKFWVQATDILGNQKQASTHVTVDFTPPIIENADNNNITRLDYNIPDPKEDFNYSSRIKLQAYDNESSVHQIVLNFVIRVPERADMTVDREHVVAATTDDPLHPDRSPICEKSINKSTCFLRNQSLFFDNCWLMVPNKDYLDSASATVNVRVFNQAMLTSSLAFEIPKISDLDGLQQYVGPENIRIVNVKSDGFRVAWDPPKVMSCYGSADILLALFIVQGDGLALVTRRMSSTALFFDFGGLNSETDYYVEVASVLGGGGKTDALELKARTAVQEGGGVSAAVIGGVAAGVIALVAIALVIFIILVRRGVLHPAERVRKVKRAVTQKYRQTVYGNAGRRNGGRSNPSYDPEDSRGRTPYDNNGEGELYIYGGMDINDPEIKHIDRDDIVFKETLKDGHFARIYLAAWRTGREEETVVAKTLKENFTAADRIQMNAKITFTGTVVGDHPNVLKFLGAVTGDEAMGPFIIYEYCENGTLKDYLVNHKNDLSIELQEALFRYGLDIAKGMEYLASKGIVHRRLAARNILLTFLNEVKIAGFGPQPDEDMDADSNKQERIPVKWMPPECLKSTRDATEKSDVWSYAVVLWEIFSLGDTPYENVRSRDLPTKLKKGYRLPKPEQCDDVWYDVMSRCWTFERSQRPTFSEIRGELDSLFTAAGEDYYIYKR